MVERKGNLFGVNDSVSFDANIITTESLRSMSCSDSNSLDLKSSDVFDLQNVSRHSKKCKYEDIILSLGRTFGPHSWNLFHVNISNLSHWY